MFFSDLFGECQSEPDPFGLARDERLAQEPPPAPGAVPVRCRRPRCSPRRPFEMASRPTSPPVPRGLDGVQGQIQHGGPNARRVGEELERLLPSLITEHDLGVLARRMDQEGDILEELPQVAKFGRSSVRRGRGRGVP